MTSLAVIDELERGDFAARADCLGLVAELPVLAIEAPILEIVQAYIRHRVMPTDQSGNSADATMANARAEGVADRVAVETGDMRRLPFADSTFDVCARAT